MGEGCNLMQFDFWVHFPALSQVSLSLICGTFVKHNCFKNWKQTTSHWCDCCNQGLVMFMLWNNISGQYGVRVCIFGHVFGIRWCELLIHVLLKQSKNSIFPILVMLWSWSLNPKISAMLTHYRSCLVHLDGIMAIKLIFSYIWSYLVLYFCLQFLQKLNNLPRRYWNWGRFTSGMFRKTLQPPKLQFCP